MKLIKDGKIVELTDEAFISAYLSDGWKPLENQQDKMPKPQPKRELI